MTAEGRGREAWRRDFVEDGGRSAKKMRRSRFEVELGLGLSKEGECPGTIGG